MSPASFIHDYPRRTDLDFARQLEFSPVPEHLRAPLHIERVAVGGRLCVPFRITAESASPRRFEEVECAR